MSDNIDTKKRRTLLGATVAVGTVAGVGAVYPLLASMQPSARALAAGASVEIDISNLQIGQQVTVEWRGKPVWIVRRSKKSLEDLATLNDSLVDPNSDVPQQPEYAKNANRSIKDEFLVIVGICTHLGCVPTYRPDIAPADLGADWKGGFFCPCHGSTFDLAGRVYKGVPAPTNLVVPPYKYLSEAKLLIGEGEIT
ncbi:MAG: ubiquinol-cytochrome c reductase iron-sulfur subunit [Gammaproteobacteria bacterium]|nr:MAG: ubiquinol-cytochrome c reductase iron-sulfur subunit [Gammaproteobacteria bacterium]